MSQRQKPAGRCEDGLRPRQRRPGSWVHVNRRGKGGQETSGDKLRKKRKTRIANLNSVIVLDRRFPAREHVPFARNPPTLLRIVCLLWSPCRASPRLYRGPSHPAR